MGGVCLGTSTKAKGEYGTAADLPEGVTATVAGSQLVVKGPLGQVMKDLSKVPVNIALEGRRIVIRPYSTRKQALAVVNTVNSHLKNMVTGVTKGFTYRLKVVYAHFPISVKTKGDQVHVENFYGERSPRIAQIVGHCTVTVEGDDVVVRGISIEDVGQTAANIEQATTVRRKDQRVFLDGVYVYEKERRR